MLAAGGLSVIGTFSGNKNGDADHALVGAATISFSGLGYIHQPGLNFSGDGRIKAFDASADGMVVAEGVAVIDDRLFADDVMKHVSQLRRRGTVQDAYKRATRK